VALRKRLACRNFNYPQNCRIKTRRFADVPPSVRAYGELSPDGASVEFNRPELGVLVYLVPLSKSLETGYAHEI
jgi:hypothetical protein